MKSDNLKVTVLQKALIWEDRIRNCARFGKTIDTLPKTDLIVLPEMFSTGFVTEPQSVAEGANGKTLDWMKYKAVEKNCAIAGSVAVEEDGKYFNRFYFVTPKKGVDIASLKNSGYEEKLSAADAVYYDKHHLFTYSGENKRFTAGDHRVVVEWRGFRFLLLVCYDLRFPGWARNAIVRKDGIDAPEFDAIIYVASWPTVRLGAWTTLLHARAIENQCFVIGANRVGDDPNCKYSGGSMIINPYGKRIAECKDGCEDACSAELDMEELNAFRKKFPVLYDAD